MSRFYTYLMTIVGLVCAYFVVRLFFFTDLTTRTFQSDVLQGVLIGTGLAFVTAQVYGRLKGTKVNGWVTTYGCGKPGNGMILRAAHSWTFMGPVNVPEEAMYWYTNSDGAGHMLDGRSNYRLRFPPGQLPPNDAFWSLTMGDLKNHFVPNPLNRYSVSNRTGLAQNADGSIDIYIQRDSPKGHEQNWLPAPSGRFLLWLRVYIPGQAILDRSYVVPPVMKAQ
jgi:hypothetical protein